MTRSTNIVETEEELSYFEYLWVVVSPASKVALGRPPGGEGHRSPHKVKGYGSAEESKYQLVPLF